VSYDALNCAERAARAPRRTWLGRRLTAQTQRFVAAYSHRFPQAAIASTVADFAALPYSSAMSDLTDRMFATHKLKQPSTSEIENAIADGLSKLIGEEQIFSAKISSLEWHSMDLKISLTIHPAFLDRPADEENQVEQPSAV
jgi:hypothetical protein